MEAPTEPEHPWPRPPDGGWCADDLDTLPDLPPHTELIDGSLVFPTRQNLFHMLAVSFLEQQLSAAAPDGFDVLREFTIDIDRWNRPEPDVIVVAGGEVEDLDQTRLPAESVLLAVEVVSPGGVTRDRETKPVTYARAGIPHFWRVENRGGLAMAYVFEREPATGVYTGTGIFHGRLEVSVPFPVIADLTEITSHHRS
ncbi:Uma2 family endonuclease [Streptomyces globosus]|uniref:Uma2 family endonuclease n=1 Tax=Streptomyces globosus TaxID=68209 RepID=UPI001FE44BCE|nr:Uma2 family endonuclease [Streptomyces globosus]